MIIQIDQHKEIACLLMLSAQFDTKIRLIHGRHYNCQQYNYNIHGIMKVRAREQLLSDTLTLRGQKSCKMQRSNSSQTST